MCGCVFVLAGGSAAQAEALDQGSVARDVDLGEVVQQVASAADHEEQAAPRVMVVFVLLEVLGKVHDALGQQGPAPPGTRCPPRAARIRPGSHSSVRWTAPRKSSPVILYRVGREYRVE